ncbi:unnamed protein product [Orchesella dallaii]|uniref:Uncharacterized protein n=1 Tax=Orchesella dallaii TaxID=48710 RepID=A0ABP1S3D0_9HEXA
MPNLFDSPIKTSENMDTGKLAAAPANGQVNQIGNNQDNLLKSIESLLDKKLDSTNKKIDNINTFLKSSISKQDVKIENLELKVNWLERNCESLMREVNEKNLVFSGIREEESETEETLMKIISNIIRKITKLNIQPDVIFRLGGQRTNTIRPVKVKFNSVGHRNAVLQCWSKDRESPKLTGFYEGIFINEDLPYTIRRDHAILRKGKKIINQKGLECKIDWKSRSIDVDDGSTYTVKDGKLNNHNTATSTGKNKNDEIIDAVNFQRRSLAAKRHKPNENIENGHDWSTGNRTPEFSNPHQQVPRQPINTGRLLSL